ncbi:HU domain-containing protein [Marinilabilia salmonicolor]|uniref:HU domain-containing protein n=1 Tax=Marinilabilia salmonicolor TaxID=989 RepID=UPI000299E534|nr:hypothetical protein [Marinilabilia salmonicolor]
MANIEKHISDLLCLHDCVIVPGLGGFVANYKSASIVDERNHFTPPEKEIGFNRSLSHNDGLLTNHLIRREQKSWDESSALIREFVGNLQTRIDEGVTMELKGIGAFRKDALGNLQFNPVEQNQLLPSAFGLGDFHFEPLVSNHSNTSKQEEPVRRLLQSRSPRYWTSVAAMIAGLLLFSPKLDMPEHHRIDSSNMISMVADDAVSAPSDETTEVAETTLSVPDEIEGEEINKLQDAKQETKAANVAKPFHLIAASFKYRSPADQTMEAFKNDGFSEAKVLDSPSGRYRIALFSFADREEATRKLFALRKDEAYKNVWLLAE